MFRIDKTLVNLATARSIQVDGDAAEAGAAGIPLYASASADYIVQETLRSAEEKASVVISEARNEAAALMISAREEAEETRRRAWQEGYAEGAKEGKSASAESIRIAEENRRTAEEDRRIAEEGMRTAEEGMRAAEERYKRKASEDGDMLERVIGELYDERERTYNGLEDSVVGLALEIVKKIINPAEEELGGVFESLIRNALKQIAPEGKIIIRVSPAEYERFFSSGSAIFHLDKGVTVTASILRDASLNDGDCIIDTEDETVNAGFDTQLKYIRIAFNRAND